MTQAPPASPDEPAAQTEPTEPATPPGGLARVANALRRHPIRLASTLVVVGLAAAAAAGHGWTARQIALSFNAQTTHYSELFFTTIGQLPAHVTPGTPGKVDFSIVNREGRTQHYRYLVAVTVPGLPKHVEVGHVTIEDNRKAEVLVPFEVAGAHTAYTVTIRLNQPFDVIEFHGRTT